MTDEMDDPDENPLDVEGLAIDFSEAHFLDHSFWTCTGLPGGRRRHLQYLWTYQWRPLVAAQTRCRLGMHHKVTGWQRGRRLLICSSCLKRFSG